MTKVTAERLAERLLTEGAPADGEPVNHALYEEYLRGFDDIPVLDDAVRIPPRPAPPPSFVRGERRSLRKHERNDGYLLREAFLAELERQYQEYVAPLPDPAKKAKKRRKRKKRR